MSETQNIIIDENVLAGVTERLDRIISLLEPSAADEAAAEEAAEAIGEALEAAAREAEDPLTAEIAGAMEEILDPVASVIQDPEEDAEEGGENEVLPARDALRAALSAVSPVLARMPRNRRLQIAADISARLGGAGNRRKPAAGIYGRLASVQGKTAPAAADLGRRIMEKRNASYRK